MQGWSALHEWNVQGAVKETNQWEIQIISPGFWCQRTEFWGCRFWSLVSSKRSTVWGGLSCFPVERQLTVLTFHGSSSQAGLFQKWWALNVLYLVVEHAAVRKLQDCKQSSLNGARLKCGSAGISRSIDHPRAFIALLDHYSDLWNFYIQTFILRRILF